MPNSLKFGSDVVIRKRKKKPVMCSEMEESEEVEEGRGY